MSIEQNLSIYFSAFVIGLLGAGHCLGMCGGIVNAFNFSLPAEKRSSSTLYWYQLTYNAGRISCYVVLGGMVGFLGHSLESGWGQISLKALRIFSSVMIILLGFYLTGWWPILRVIELFGKKIWDQLRPLTKYLIPIDRPIKAYLLGFFWGGLPCGLIYSTLGLALSAGSLSEGMLTMGVFGLGTLPALLLTGNIVRLIQSFKIKFSLIQHLAGITLIALGAISLSWYLPAIMHGHQCH